MLFPLLSLLRSVLLPLTPPPCPDFERKQKKVNGRPWERYYKKRGVCASYLSNIRFHCCSLMIPQVKTVAVAEDSAPPEKNVEIVELLDDDEEDDGPAPPPPAADPLALTSVEQVLRIGYFGAIPGSKRLAYGNRDQGEYTASLARANLLWKKANKVARDFPSKGRGETLEHEIWVCYNVGRETEDQVTSVTAMIEDNKTKLMKDWVRANRSTVRRSGHELAIFQALCRCLEIEVPEDDDATVDSEVAASSDAEVEVDEEDDNNASDTEH